MKSIFWRMTLKLKRKPYWAQMGIFYLSIFLIALSVIPFILITNKLVGENNESPHLTDWFLVIIFAPIFETLISQLLPFKLMQKWNWTKNKYGLYILVSAIIFGLGHTYSLQYMILTFSGGLILGYMYYFYSKTPKKSFWSVTLIHALKNSLAILAIILADKF